MSSINLPVLLLLAFLVINLLVGVVKGRGVNTVKDFAVGNKHFGSMALASTLLATCIGANSIYGTSSRLVSIGFVAILGYVFCSIAFILNSLLFPHQLARFSDCVTFGDFIGQLYGRFAKSFSGLFGGLLCLLTVACQIQALGTIFSDLFDADLMVSILLSTILISVYTALGGMRSVVATDILQAVMTFGVLFVLVFFTYNHAIGESGYVNLSRLPARLISTRTLNFEYFATRMPMLLFLSNTIPVFQRLLMSQNKIVAKKMYLYTSLGNIILGVMLVAIVFFSIITLGNGLSSGNAINHIIKALIPKQIIPLMGLGLVAVVFSTADSFLHSAGLCLSKDFLEPILKRDIKLIEVRFVVLFCGFLSMLIVLYSNNLLKLPVDHLQGPILAVPVLYGVLGAKTSSRMFFSSACLGFLTCFIVSKYPSIKAFNVLFGCFASFFAYFLVHLYENKGFNFIGEKFFISRKQVKGEDSDFNLKKDL